MTRDDDFGRGAWLDHGDVALFHGDCRDVLPNLDREYSLLLTDPPYGISAKDITRNHGHTLRQDFFPDDTVDAPMEGLALALDRLMPDAAAFIYCGHQQFGPIEQLLTAHGFTTGPFVWTKTNPVPSVRMAGWRHSLELAVWGERGKPFRWSNQERALNRIHAPACVHGHPEKNGHQTQKPMAVVMQAIEHYTVPGETILDPFAGSGTTLEAARKLGRRADGIERDAEHLPRIAGRLAQQSLLADGAA